MNTLSAAQSLLRRYHRMVFCLLCLFSLLSARPDRARAQGEVSVTFNPATMTAMPGDTVNYSAVFTNNTATDLFISSASFNSSDADFFTTDNNFGLFNGNGLGDGSFTLAANSIMSLPDVISLFLDPSTPTGLFTIDATFTGRNQSDVGNVGVNDRDLGTGPFDLVITDGTDVPEPGSMALFTGIVIVGAGFVRRRRA